MNIGKRLLLIAGTYIKKILGLDLSKTMLKIAKNKIEKKGLSPKKIDLNHGNIINFKSKEKFNVAYSLFDVICLITKDSDIKKIFLNLYKHLEPGSLVYLDYWYKPAVFHMKIKILIENCERFCQNSYFFN